MNSPFFSVIIPAHNRAAIIANTIQTVTSQNFPDFEIIVVDDGSMDNTGNIIATIEDPRITYRRTANNERAAARNAGIRIATGKYITFLDSDDQFFPNHLSHVFNQLSQKKYPAFYHQAYCVMDEDGKRHSWATHPYDDPKKALWLHGNILSCAGVFIKDEVLQENLFNEDRELSGLEDWELWIRLAERYPIVSDPLVTSAVINHAGRSVRNERPERILRRADLFLQYVQKGKYPSADKYSSSLAANVYAYASLQLSEASVGKGNAKSLLKKSIRMDMNQLFRKRTWAIVRNLYLAHEK